MIILVIILVILLCAALFYIIRLKHSIRQAKDDIYQKRLEDTNTLITTTNHNQELCELLQEVNEMMKSFHQLEREIEQKNQHLQRTIVNISHDLKTPLTSALGYEELLQKYDLSKDEQQRYHTIVIDKLKRLSQLIEDFFAFTKIIANNDDLVMEQLDVNRILEEELVCFYQDFNEQQRSIHITGNQKYIMTTNDRVMRRIFDNLIINALKHSQDDLYIDIVVSNNITYRFTNKLIEPIQVERIFDEFYTSDISRTKQHTGLGLAIVKEFSMILGGQVKAEVVDNDLIITLSW